MEPSVCPNCSKELTKLQMMTLNGAFGYKIPVCPFCNLKKDGTEFVMEEPEESFSFNTITCESISGKTIKTSQLKNIMSRVLTDDGETVLSGKEGVKYMESKAKKSKQYQKRLKDYNNL